MLDQLNAVIADLPKLLKERDQWQSLIVNRRKPHTYRVFRQIGELRVCIHRFEVCDEQEAFLHPHPWPGAFCILRGSYLMTLGQSIDRVSEPTISSKIVMVPGSKYEITSPLTWHSVTPIGDECWTIMVNGKPWDSSVAHAKVTTTKGKDLNSMESGDLRGFLDNALEIFLSLRNTKCLT